jgi:hypothetical protein
MPRGVRDFIWGGPVVTVNKGLWKFNGLQFLFIIFCPQDELKQKAACRYGPCMYFCEAEKKSYLRGNIFGAGRWIKEYLKFQQRRWYRKKD